MVYGTLTNDDWYDGNNVTIFGHGTLSGDKLPHPDYSGLPPSQTWTLRPIHIRGTHGTTVEGLTIANSAHHSVMLVSNYDLERPTQVKWTKIFTWRANGDGINPFGGTSVEDCFIRTQDDSTYVSGAGIRRVVYWQVQYSTAQYSTVSTLDITPARTPRA